MIKYIIKWSTKIEIARLVLVMFWSQSQCTTPIRDCTTKVGFRVSQVISEPGATCLAYGVGQDDASERYHVLVLRSGGVSSTLTVVLVSGGC